MKVYIVSDVSTYESYVVDVFTQLHLAWLAISRTGRRFDYYAVESYDTDPPALRWA